MNRDEFVDLLARLVGDGLLDEEDALDLLREFDAGTLSDVWQLPLPPQEAIRRHDDLVVVAALALLLSLRRDRAQVVPASVGAPIPVTVTVPFTLTATVSTANTVQGAFEARVRALASQWTGNQITLAQWQTAMATEIEQHLVQQMAAGSRSQALSARQLQRLDDIMREQTAYLSRFADEIAGRQGAGQALSEAQIAIRSESYAGAGRGQFFREAEEADLEQGNLGAGYVVDYISRDDGSTCLNCLDAQRAGPYLPGEGPMPGEVCLGRSRCRCRREARLDMQAYQEIAGVVA